jgi:hypothetical protein
MRQSGGLRRMHTLLSTQRQRSFGFDKAFICFDDRAYVEEIAATFGPNKI